MCCVTTISNDHQFSYQNTSIDLTYLKVAQAASLTCHPRLACKLLRLCWQLLHAALQVTVPVKYQLAARHRFFAPLKLDPFLQDYECP